MIASLLPGIRELRTPLAAGVLWLVFAYLAVGAPDAVEDAPGPVQDVLDLTKSIGSAATGAVVSFLAYLVGSISHDLFGRVLPGGIVLASKFIPRFDRFSTTFDQTMAVVHEQVPKLVGREEERLNARLTARAAAEQLLELLESARAEGASESVRPEALRPMMQAEEDLRLAVFPPLVGMTLFLTFSEHLLWFLGLIFCLALFLQAADRRIRSEELGLQYRRVTAAQHYVEQLEQLLDALASGNDEVAAEIVLNSSDWDRFRRTLGIAWQWD